MRRLCGLLRGSGDGTYVTSSSTSDPHTEPTESSESNEVPAKEQPLESEEAAAGNELEQPAADTQDSIG